MSSAAGPTPATLGALEPVRQRGAGTCGTVDCCCERESQTHLWEAPSGGPKRPCHPGAAGHLLTTERVRAGLANARGQILRARARPQPRRDSQASLDGEDFLVYA